jgi:glycosyltransferase involved in cell wall biosynthesis
MADTSLKGRQIQISAVIPAYNIEQYIARAIDSVLNQTYRPDEIIVVDDGSSDRTAEKIKAYGDKVKYIYQDNKGLSGARNTGIRNAQHDWIAFLDGDDEWLSEYLAMQATVLRRNPDLLWSTGNFICCLCDENKKGPHIDPAMANRALKGKKYFPSYFEAFTLRMGGNADTMILHRSLFDTIGLFNEDQTFSEDLEMWWRIAFEYPEIGYVASPCAVYHLQRPGTLTEEFKKTKLKVLVDLVEKNLRTAERKNMQNFFEPVVKRLVTSWIRGLLFENRPGEIHQLLVRFDVYLSTRFKCLIRLLMLFPKATAWGCHLISKIVRCLKLRKQIIRPPS